MPPQFRALLAIETVPEVGAENRDALVGNLLRIFRIEILRPVDARGGVPLQVLALLVELAERVAALLVFPFENGVELAGYGPLGCIHGNRVTLFCAHWRTSG